VLHLVSGQAFRALTALGILISTTACDNVEWGGVELRLLPPPARAGSAADSARAEGEGGFVLPSGAVLYLATRDSAGLALIPVGEIAGDSIRAFPDESEAPGYRGEFARVLMAPGSRFTLFSAGARVGTFTVAEVGTDERFCSPRPRAVGYVELVPAAAEATRFLALPESFTAERGYSTYQPMETDRAQRAIGIDVAAEMIPQIGAQWPATDLATARGDIQAFPLATGGSAVSSTFVYRDQALVQPAIPSSYSLFVLATGEGEAYSRAYTWYREASREGKGVPIYFQHLDWDGDGETEVLLEVRGERARWNAAVERVGSEWQRTFEDPCGAAAAPVTQGTGG
jgi:hypothetical protein